MTAENILKIARGEIGVKEVPAGSNKVKYNTWYYGKEVSGSAYPWCMAFVQWVFDQAGAPIGHKTASCTQLMNWARQRRRWVTSGYKPGDVVIFDFGSDGSPDHVGILEAAQGGKLICIEGNTSVTSDDNGGAVMRRNRTAAQVLGAYRPEYKEEKKMDNEASKWAKEAVEKAIQAGLIKGDENGNLMLHEPVTREQLCVFLDRLGLLGE